MNMVEKVARAIHATTYLTPSWKNLNRTEKDSYFTAAKAAIAAMREPSLFMCESVGASYGSALHYDWIKMIDAALKEE